MARRQNPKIERTLKRTATKHLNIGSCYISTYIKDPYTEDATVRCFPIRLASDTVRQKGTP